MATGSQLQVRRWLSISRDGDRWTKPNRCEGARPSYAHSAFWSQVSNNFLDVAVLEWCKLLGDDKDKHFWRNVVADPTAFEASLLVNLGMTESEFADFAKKMRRYRDKFVAHLDSEATIDTPHSTLRSPQTVFIMSIS
jgi:hypothetical protein